MEKKIYEKPQISEIEIHAEQFIATSGPQLGDSGNEELSEFEQWD